MYADNRKIHIIEAILRINNEKTLPDIEEVIKEAGNVAEKKSAREFVGIWNKEEAEAIEKAIEEDCEQINPDDWK